MWRVQNILYPNHPSTFMVGSPGRHDQIVCGHMFHATILGRVELYNSKLKLSLRGS